MTPPPSEPTPCLPAPPPAECGLARALRLYREHGGGSWVFVGRTLDIARCAALSSPSGWTREGETLRSTYFRAFPHWYSILYPAIDDKELMDALAAWLDAHGHHIPQPQMPRS